MKKYFVWACYVVAALCVLAFGIKTVIDGVRYDAALTSFPFYTIVLFNAFYFLFPAAITFAVGLILHKKGERA